MKKKFMTHHKIITARCLVRAGTVEIEVLAIEGAVVWITGAAATSRSWGRQFFKSDT